jgi:hypothetical protein
MIDIITGDRILDSIKNSTLNGRKFDEKSFILISN